MLNDVEVRLKVCFRTVFPDLPDETISSAAQTNVAAWDSVATVTLVSVIDEEFGVELDLDRLGELDSFKSICACIKDEGQAV